MNNSDKNRNHPQTVQILDYQILETVYSGSRTLVYRAVRTQDQLPVVIKLLKNDYPTFSELLSFRNQYTIAKNLKSPLIIQTYSLPAYQNGYALVMEDFGGISLHEWAVKGKNTLGLREFLEIAITLCNALDILYRERIIHKDIKPANILIHPETKQVKLIDFSIASLLPRETQTLMNPNVLEGTLAYISPEQTGRMNRGIDYRTDFYSLGVTFYELLTGKLPFASNDAMELVHCHLAKHPPNLRERGKARKAKQIPQVLCDIVMKLMAKNAEHRYQSALGLKYDLEKCLTQIQENGQIESFKIGQRDLCDRFIIPDKLYGRETEIETLLQAFERVANPPESPGFRGVEMMLVAGFSGIGKTAVVNEVHKPIVRQRGYFLKGKYDQFNRNIPLSAFVQAFRHLMAQLLSESDEQLEKWKNKILSALGESGQVMIEVIPELERIIGKQPPAPELSGSAAQNRFNLLFQKFIQVFTTKEHPLVMFLDDLQWADSASLNLLKLLMAETERGYLLIIGAYRDNEVFAAHPLMLTLDEIQKTQASINTLTLANLSQADVNHLIADSLSCATKQALPLTELVYQKAKGNPFFTTQFLKALHEDGLITFDPPVSPLSKGGREGGWQCDVAQVRSLALTDDVVEFMAIQLQKLPSATQNILKLAACVGNQFDLSTLAIVCEQSLIETAADLWKALQEGFIIPINEIYKFYQTEASATIIPTSAQKVETCAYKFLHDRVQQAAYSLIPDEEKQATHQKIGQLLLKNTPVTEQNENLFEIVNQLNIGKSLIVERSQQIELAQLNLKAGQKARSATAYAAALEYSSTGISLLNFRPSPAESCWQTDYNLTLELYEIATETAYLSGDFQQMEERADIVMQQAKNAVDKMKVYAVKIQAYMAQVKKLEAVKLGLEALELVGVSLPESPEPSEIQQALTQTANNLQGQKIEDLINLPLMTDVEKLAAAKMLASMGPPTYQATPVLFPLVMCELVNLSIKYGNSPFSSYGYACYGILLNAVLQDADSAYRFGKLASSLAEHFNAPEITSSVFLVVGACTIHGKADVRETLPILANGYQNGLESGNFEFAAYCAIHKGQHFYFIGQELTVVEREMAIISDALVRVKQENALAWNRIFHQSVLKLLNPSESPVNLQGEVYNDRISLPRLQNANDRSELHYLYFNKLIVSYLFGEYKEAQENALEAETYLDAVQGLLVVPIFNFYNSLAHLATYPSVPDSQQEQFLNRVANNQEKMKQWATDAPMNFQHKFDLVAAEQYRILGNKADAMDYYDRAIALAKEQGYIQEEALANELAAKFYLDWGKEKVAQAYMTEAYYCYARWGAKAKVADLEQRYRQLLATILQPTATSLTPTETVYAGESRFTTQTSSSGSSSSASVALDLSAILKASQNLSSEMQLDKLLSVLLEIVTATAGADKCVLMLLDRDRLSIEAVAEVGQSPVVLQSIPVSESEDVPVSLVNTVKRTLQPIVIVNAAVEPSLLAEPYVLRQQPKSLLCTPIIYQAKLVGVLYLENNLATGAFTSDRIELLNLLCTQAAISLENARLYTREQEKSQSLQASLEKLKQTEASLAKEREFLKAIIHNITDGIVVCDASGKLTLFNQATREFHGLPVESLPPEEWSEHFALYRPDGQTLLPTTEIPLFRALQGEIVENAEMVIAPKQGSQRILLASGQAIFDPWGNKVGAVVVMRDISDRKQAELAILQKSQELEHALQDLQQAQLQIVQSEKMSALGNLVAGVAHEMNNPLGFISASLEQTKPTLADLIEHLNFYQASLPNPSDEIIDHAEEIDLDYTLEDLPKVIDSMGMACDRLKNISTSLRTFSRADRDYKVPFNIHEGLDSTILILKHRLKANEQRPAIETIANYGNLPQVECFPGQVNQVFMNILANAIDVLDESNIGRNFAEIKINPNCIKITTSLENNQVKIAIADNGKGMTDEIKQKIFDHLFTTKAVGKGTGLGLAIARQIIVEKHGGLIHVDSILGEGTEFIITLPIKAEKKS